VSRRRTVHAFRDDMRDEAIRAAAVIGKPVAVRSVCRLVTSLPADLVPGAPLQGVTCKRCRAAVTEEIVAAEIPEPEAFRVRGAARGIEWDDPTAEAALRRAEIRATARHETDRIRARRAGQTVGETAYLDWSKVTVSCAHVDAGSPVFSVDPTELEGVRVRLAMCDSCHWSYSLGSPIPLTSGVTIYRVTE
jgi:hypothetical protein